MPESPASPSPPEGSSRTKTLLVAGAALLAMLASAWFIYRTEFAGNDTNLDLHRAVGQVMAEETVRVVGHIGKVVLITVDPSVAPELKVQVAAFEKHLKELGGASITQKIVLDPGDNVKYRPGAGLSAKHFLKIARKNKAADAFVSFVGVPELTDADLQQLRSAPKLIAETHSPEKLVNLLDKKILLAALVPRFEFPAPGPRKPQTSRQWFDRYFQIVAPGSVLPGDDASP